MRAQEALSVNFIEFDNCPAPAELYSELHRLKARSGATLDSCYRGTDPRGVAILRANGKQSQAQLYDGWVNRRPGYNPANAPGRSSHELRSDGIAYRGPVGRPLKGWQVGMDWRDVEAVLAAGRAEGLALIQPYHDGRERHHLNFAREPRSARWLKPLSHGSRGVRVRHTVAKLRTVGLLGELRKPWLYSAPVVEAVRRFQRRHGLVPDGVAGWKTMAALTAAARAASRPRTDPPPKPKPVPGSAARQGIDVSAHQPHINWAKVRGAGIDWAILKATEGQDYRDPSFTDARIAAIRAAGLHVGAYHFLRPKPGRTGDVEADWFLSVIRHAGLTRPGSIVPVLDCEVTALGPEATGAYILQAARRIRAELGVWPVVYTGFYYCRDQAAGMKGLGECPLWLAAYVRDPAGFIPAPWQSAGWTLWQHSSSGHVPGIAEPADLNVLNASKRLPLIPDPKEKS